MLSNVFGNMVSKGGDGLQSLAMATWQICGGPRRRVAIPENVAHRGGKEMRDGDTVTVTAGIAGTAAT